MSNGCAPNIRLHVGALGLSLLLSCAEAIAAEAAQSAAPATLAPHPTTVVKRSADALPAPYPTVHNVPRTLSIDPMTDAEILQAQREIFEEIKDNEDRRIEGIDGCMHWTFLRHHASEPWRAVGFGIRGGGLLKLNGALRSARISYSFAPELGRGLFSKDGPSRRPGGGSIVVFVFEPKPGYRDWIRGWREDDRIAGDLLRGELGPDARYLVLAPSTSALVIDKADMACTHLAARCRRYKFAVNRDAEWVGRIASQAENVSPGVVRQPIATAPGLKLEMAIEDMCPFSRDGLVEGSINTRVGGAEPGVRKYGLKNNASLEQALRPYAQQAKR